VTPEQVGDRAPGRSEASGLALAVIRRSGVLGRARATITDALVALAGALLLGFARLCTLLPRHVGSSKMRFA
jgi:hypothetical protein